MRRGPSRPAPRSRRLRVTLHSSPEGKVRVVQDPALHPSLRELLLSELSPSRGPCAQDDDRSSACQSTIEGLDLRDGVHHRRPRLDLVRHIPAREIHVRLVPSTPLTVECRWQPVALKMTCLDLLATLPEVDGDPSHNVVVCCHVSTILGVQPQKGCEGPGQKRHLCWCVTSLVLEDLRGPRSKTKEYSTWNNVRCCHVPSTDDSTGDSIQPLAFSVIWMIRVSKTSGVPTSTSISMGMPIDGWV